MNTRGTLAESTSGLEKLRDKPDQKDRPPEESTSGNVVINVGRMMGGIGGAGGPATHDGTGGPGGPGNGPRIVDNLTAQNVFIHNHGHANRVVDAALEAKLESWLHAPDPTENHFRSCSIQNRSPCSWLFEDTQLISWQNNSGEPLWIEGPSGTGKTIIRYLFRRTCVSRLPIINARFSSMIIQKLFNDRASLNDGIAIAYFYFDFTDLTKQSVDYALRRLVLQLSRQSLHANLTLKQQYDRCSSLTVPNYQELLIILQRHLGMFDRTYLVLDALDEAEDHERVAEFVETICSWSDIRLHVFVTSQTRRVFEKKFPSLKSLSRITIKAGTTSGDIRSYISKELESRDEFQGWKPEWARITQLILKKSAGMFRMAYCLVNELEECARPDDLQEALAALPNDLHDIYARPFKSVPQKHLGAVHRLLQWLAFSARPLTLAEIEDAIAFDFSNPDRYTFDPRKRPMRGFFIKWLSGLVSITNSSQEGVLDSAGSYRGDSIVRLAHSSVQDYLLRSGCTSCPHVSVEEAHPLMAQTCVCYLLYFADHSLNKRTLPSYPLAKYAAENWVYHLQRCPDQATSSTLAMSLLETGSRQYAVLDFLDAQHIVRYDRIVESPLYLCTNHGYTDGVKFLLDQGADMNTRGKRYGLQAWCSTSQTVLQVASARGHLEIVRLLLKKGADPNAKGQEGGSWSALLGGTALLLASRIGRLEIVKLLINNGADVNAEDALQAASAAGHLELVRLLLRKGAAVTYGALRSASASGHIELVRLLLEKGADVNTIRGGVTADSIELMRLLCERFGGGDDTTRERRVTALQAASMGGHFQIVHLLLENGADIDAVGEGGNALQTASHFGHLEIAQLLLNRGAAINAEGLAGLTALQAASGNGHSGIVRLLLQNGADVNQKSQFTSTALGFASAKGHSEIVRLLLENGADVNLPALHDALVGGHLEIVHLLFEKGVDFDATAAGDGLDLALLLAFNGECIDIVPLLLDTGADVNANNSDGSALQLALFGDHLEIACLLIKKGADVNAKAGWRGSALAVASKKGNIEILHLLLDNGADVNKEDGVHPTALQAASQAGQYEIVRFLLEKGAHVNAQTKSGGTALKLASENGHIEIVKLLLRMGADVNGRVEADCTALQLAAKNGHTEIVKLLHAEGTDVNTGGTRGITALGLASRAGHIEIVEFLLKHDVDVNAKDEDGTTALQFASREGNIEIVNILLEKDADVNSKGKHGRTALELASIECYFEIVDLLLRHGATVVEQVKSMGKKRKRESRGRGNRKEEY